MIATAARGLWHGTQDVMLWWHRVKMFIEHAAIVTSDALHVLVGVGLLVVAALVLRRRLTQWLPWLVVLAAALFNETVDLWVEQWPSLAMQYGESAKDILLTMLLPTLLMAATRQRPELFIRKGFSRPPPGPDEQAPPP